MTTLNLQVSAGPDDGYFATGDPFFQSGQDRLRLGKVNTVPTLWHSFARFAPVSGIGLATINEAIYRVHEHVGNTSPAIETDVFTESAAAPAAPVSRDDAVSRTLTDASVQWDGALSVDTWNEKAITSVIQELADSFDPTAIQIMHYAASETINGRQWNVDAYDGDSSLAPQLDIDFTEQIGPASISKSARYDAIEKAGRYAPTITLTGRYDAIRKEGRYQES